ncbi:PQ loop repeat protein [Cladophialophora carrionii]|uniref:PQ loop repeat protein n=1 Tax=Cladophialophora carrionii TaxID=86049 RepID=A0A1C1C7C0_9EURO|nr:PQ loop repeat protein [Cladophialophora carrionii]
MTSHHMACFLRSASSSVSYLPPFYHGQYPLVTNTCDIDVVTGPPSVHAAPENGDSAVDEFACVAGLLGIAQVGVQWSCFGVILLLFLIFFPRGEVAHSALLDGGGGVEDDNDTPVPAPVPDRPVGHGLAKPKSSNPDTDYDSDALAPSYRTALVVVAVCVLHAALTAILSFFFIYAAPRHAQSWANFLGVLSTALASVQYFPQIYTTYRLKRVGSLSIPMMCIQTPGSFVWAGSLAARLGPEGWSAWGVYLVTGCLQGCLLGMGSYFEITRRRREKEELKRRIEYNTSVEALVEPVEEEQDEDEDQDQDASEHTPLLRRAD